MSPRKWASESPDDPTDDRRDYATLGAEGLGYLRELMDLCEQSEYAARAVHLVLRLVELAAPPAGSDTI